jgi:hypothetical protein
MRTPRKAWLNASAFSWGLATLRRAQKYGIVSRKLKSAGFSLRKYAPISFTSSS